MMAVGEGRGSIIHGRLRCYAEHSFKYSETLNKYGVVYGKIGAKIPGAKEQQLLICLRESERASEVVYSSLVTTFSSHLSGSRWGFDHRLSV